MSTAISILGCAGLFLLGMTVMTNDLKALAGSALRAVLGQAAATPLRGAWWELSSPFSCSRRVR